MKIGLFAVALACYGSAAWGALSFFRVADRGAQSGKRLVSSLAGVSMVTCLWLIWQMPGNNGVLATISGLLYVLATAIFWWSCIVARTAQLNFLGSTQAPTKILRFGPFGYVRHPFYTSYIISWLAACVAVPSIVTTLILVVLTAIYTLAARREELGFLVSPLSRAYSEYCAVTKRFLPGIY